MVLRLIVQRGAARRVPAALEGRGEEWSRAAPVTDIGIVLFVASMALNKITSKSKWLKFYNKKPSGGLESSVKVLRVQYWWDRGGTVGGLHRRFTALNTQHGIQHPSTETKADEI